MKVYKYIPDAITSMNLLCGVLGVTAVFAGRFDLAFYLMLAAACFDFCDGFSARMLKAYSDLGKELDSLADMVSFGVLPAVMLSQFMCLSTFSVSPLSYVSLLIAVFSGIRLARYNICKDNDGVFTGLTTPACAMICGYLCYYVATNPYSFLAVWAGGQIFIPVLSIILSALLVSKLPTFSLKMHRWDPASLTWTRICFGICVLICAAFAILMKLNWSLVVLSSFVVYIFLNITIFIFEKRPVVYFTRELSAEGLIKAYEMVNGPVTGKVGVKLHTGEQGGPNIIPREWVKALMAKDLPNANIIETNTYYEGDRYTTELHRQTLEVNGWTFCPVDIMDEEGTVTLPVRGKWFGEMSVGSHLLNYDSMVALTHFKGHTCGGFGGSNKNIGIGCADGHGAYDRIHQGYYRPFRRARHLCQCDAQYVGFLRL